MKLILQLRSTLSATLLLGLASVAVAHGHDAQGGSIGAGHHGNFTLPMAGQDVAETAQPSYFRHDSHSGLMLAHIVSMSIAWVFVLPLCVMLTIARSRLSLVPQGAFFILNVIGVLLVVTYNTRTPDLYRNNAHHPLGWIMTCVVTVQSCLALIDRYSDRSRGESHASSPAAGIPISTRLMKEYHPQPNADYESNYRYSHDSGQGTEPHTESLRSHSSSSLDNDNDGAELPSPQGYEDEDFDAEQQALLSEKSSSGTFLIKLTAMLSSHTLRLLTLLYVVINRVILILGFIGLATGAVTYGGIFRGGEVFSGLAHFIKGGVFFWYGVLTLGRWAGCFADIGWAWNIKPPSSRRMAFTPSAEFVESFLIFFYGSTNVFLEHLGSTDGVWSSGDLEHLSITVLFFGGGLCGMLVESTRIRDLLNAAPVQDDSPSAYSDGRETSQWQPPKSYRFSMNPLPALVVLLLGLMMSSHHQDSMVSTMIHAQWGTMLMGAAFARGVTYLLFYLSPPSSFLPSQPPTELVTAFCLLAGGLLFMASSHDTVSALEYNDINAMFAFTVTVGLVTFLMAWIILSIAIKGWAVRREGKPTYFDDSKTT